MIDEKETFRIFGYYNADLKPQSNKKIVAICDDCGKIRELPKEAYRALCLSCSRKGKRNPHFGKHHSNEAKKKISKTKKGQVSWNKGGTLSEETKQKISKTNKENSPWLGKHHSEEIKKKISKANKGKHRTKETRKKISIARQHQHFPKHHTKPELIFEEICKRNNLDFHYVGDGSLWIGKNKKLNPDFIEANGKKICVEIMGAYWHSPLLNKKIPERALQSYRKKHYLKYKWIPVFIWDTDLLREDAERFVLTTLKKEGRK